MEEEKQQQVQVDCKQEERQHERKTIVFLLPIDAHGHVNAMIGIADQLKSLGGYRTIFLCNDNQSPRHFGHELVPLRKVKRNQSIEKLIEKQAELADEERVFLGDEKLNSKWAALVELLDFRIHKPEFCVQALAHNYRLLKLTLEAEVVPMDPIIEQCLIELAPELVVVDQLCPIPAVWRLTNCAYALRCGLSKPLTWLTVASCNPMPLYHAHLGGWFPPPLMGLSTKEKLRGVELEIEQLRHERALRDSNLPETLLRMYSMAAAAAATSEKIHWSFEQFARNESPCAPNVYMFPRALDYARDGRGTRLPADRWIRVDSLVRGAATFSAGNGGSRDEQLLEQVAKWRAHKQIIIIYLSMGTTMSSNLGLMNSLVGQVCSCLEFEPRWNFALALGPRGPQLAPSIRHQVQRWQTRGRLLTSAWWPQPELLRRKLVDVCVTHGGNNTLCEVFAASNPPVHLILVAGFHDQLDNARRVADLGWGVALTASQLLEQPQPIAIPGPEATSGSDLLRSAILGSIGLERPTGEGQDEDEVGLRNSQFCAQLMARVAGGNLG